LKKAGIPRRILDWRMPAGLFNLHLNTGSFFGDQGEERRSKFPSQSLGPDAADILEHGHM